MANPGSIPPGGAFLFLRLERPVPVVDMLTRLGYLSVERLDVFEPSRFEYFDISYKYGERTERTFKDVAFAWRNKSWIHLSEVWTGILTEHINFLVNSQDVLSGGEVVYSRIPEAIDIIWGIFNDAEEGLYDISILRKGTKVIDLNSLSWRTMRLLLENLENSSLLNEEDFACIDEPDEEIKLFWSIVKCMGVDFNVDSAKVEGYLLQGMHRGMYS